MIRLLFIAILLCVPTRAFSPYYAGGKPARWDFSFTGYNANVFNPVTKAIRYSIGTDTYSVGNRTAELNAIRASFAQWQAIPGAALKFEEGPIAPSGVSMTLGDGTNVIFWTRATTINGVDISGRAGYTVAGYDANNRILEADIALNAVFFSWFTDFNNTAAGGQFVEAIVTHEVGHFLGLDHSPLGGATVRDGGPGVSPMAGLSSDEIAAARFLYPNASITAQVGAISGTVRMNNVGIHGAIVTAETSGGLAISSAATDVAGNYSLPALPPGGYNVHVSPLDPDSTPATSSLFRAIDIAPDFGAATTNFIATANSAATVNAGATTTLNFAVAAGTPMRIQQIARPVTVAAAPSPVRYAVAMNPGDSRYVGVISSSITSDATFTITGDGITIGGLTFQPAQINGMNLLYAFVTVAANATPGLRTIVVQRGNEVAYANGYFEVSNPVPDFNFDGLDDRFQRLYFPLFTAPEAAPGADPDNDHFSNAFEAMTGTNPVDANSYSFLIDRVDIVRGSARVTWKSDVGKTYQLYGKNDVAGATWQTVGTPVTASSTSTSVSDGIPSGTPKFYKLKLLP